MTEHKERALKYGTTVYAALVVLVAAVSYFVYSLIMAQPENINDYIIEYDEDGMMLVSPNPDAGPDGPPDVTPPVSPPPGN